MRDINDIMNNLMRNTLKRNYVKIRKKIIGCPSDIWLDNKCCGKNQEEISSAHVRQGIQDGIMRTAAMNVAILTGGKNMKQVKIKEPESESDAYKRSVAACKAWETRDKRSCAAYKAWETRREQERLLLRRIEKKGR